MSYILVSDECDAVEVMGDDRYGDVYETPEQAIEDMVNVDTIVHPGELIETILFRKYG
jgi:hypothetical protein|tara:strand:+ start:70 stop:243 length:174 start_codon:yes stop_codon:yes gene_type:complete